MASVESPYTIINSFQGAFGPPTAGHYAAMHSAALATLHDYPAPTDTILMLYMPTAASSSKKHLEPTQAARAAALQYFCGMLNADKHPELVANRNRIFFDTSMIEYELYNKTEVLDEPKRAGDTGTYWTLKVLQATYPSARICITMGLDNLFDLPFWLNVQKYPEYLRGEAGQIYVLQRDEEAEIDTQTHAWVSPIKFNKFASWHPKFKDGSIHQTQYEASDLYTKLSTRSPGPDGQLLDTILKSIHFRILNKPPPTSSSLLRAALIKYYGTNTKAPNVRYYNALKILEAPHIPRRVNDPAFTGNDPWYQSYLISSRLEDPKKLNAFNTEFNAKFPDVLSKAGGRRHYSRLNRSRSQKKIYSKRKTAKSAQLINFR